MAILSAKAIQLNAAYNFTPTLALVSGDLSSYTVTVNTSTNIFTANGHDFVAGVPVRFSNAGGGLPDGIDSTTLYFVVNPAINTFQVSTSINGSPVDITSTGSGITTVNEQPMGDEDDSGSIINEYTDGAIAWDVMVRHEVDYNGASRVQFYWGSASVNTTVNSASLPTATISIIPINGEINMRYAVILRGASPLIGDSTGSVEICQDASQIIPIQGVSFSFTPIML